jgi:hypothetical protein
VPPKLTAIGFGAVYAATGLFGFAVTGFSGSGTLVVFDLSVLANLVHLAVGALGAAAFTVGNGASRMFARVFGVLLAALAVVGVIIPNPLGLLPIGGADIVLHTASAFALLYVGFSGTNEEVPSP